MSSRPVRGTFRQRIVVLASTALAIAFVVAPMAAPATPVPVTATEGCSSAPCTNVNLTITNTGTNPITALVIESDPSNANALAITQCTIDGQPGTSDGYTNGACGTTAAGVNVAIGQSIAATIIFPSPVPVGYPLQEWDTPNGWATAYDHDVNVAAAAGPKPTPDLDDAANDIEEAIPLEDSARTAYTGTGGRVFHRDLKRAIALLDAAWATCLQASQDGEISAVDADVLRRTVRSATLDDKDANDPHMVRLDRGNLTNREYVEFRLKSAERLKTKLLARIAKLKKQA